MKLNEHQQWVINIALELEGAGHAEAARYLRNKHFPGINWHQMLTTHVPWEEVFRRHNEAEGTVPF